MLKEIFNSAYFSKLLAVFILGLAIKILDDYIDDDENTKIKTIMPYGLLFLSISALLDLSSISLFLSSYMVGMFKDLESRFPSGMFGWCESILIFILGMFFFGYREMISSVLIIIFIQLMDDIIDYKDDKLVSRKNYAIRYGAVETALIGIIFLSISVMMDFSKTFLVVLSTPCVLVCYKRIFCKIGGNVN